MMTLNEARDIGQSKLKIDAPLFQKCVEEAKKMEVEAQHLGPMALAIAIMGVSKAQTTDMGLQHEMRDALNIVSQAEREWRMDQKVGRGPRQ